MAPGAAVPGQVIAMQRASGRPRVLVGVRTEKCPHCLSGWRTVSTWATLAGATERISWCRHCFNAQSAPSQLSDEERSAFDLACAAIERDARMLFFECARHAVDFLEALAPETRSSPERGYSGLVEK